MAKFPYYSDNASQGIHGSNGASSASGLPNHITIGELLDLHSSNVRDMDRLAAFRVGERYGSYHDWSAPEQARPSFPNLATSVATAWRIDTVQASQAAQASLEVTGEANTTKEQDKKKDSEGV